MSADKPLVLVDGSSYLFRAFHALPPLRNRKGQDTGAIKGVISMLRRLRTDYPGSPIAVVFDAKGKTFRNDIYAEYKAHRPPMPDELRSQIAPIHDIITAMGLPLLVIDKVEADDVIGTLATQATRDQRHTVVSTGDKDLAQLVSDHVALINTMSNEYLDREGVLSKFSLPPESIIDYLALTGDKVDNIPGVPGVGPKTAIKWLQEYGTVEQLLANADKIGGKIGERLRENIDSVWLSRELATIKCDVELDVDIHALIPQPEDKSRLLALFRELEFKTWIKELETALGNAADEQGADSAQTSTQTNSPTVTDPDRTPALAEKQSAVSADYQLVTDESGLDACIRALQVAGSCALSVETDGAHFMQTSLIGIALATAPGQAWYIPLGHDLLDNPAQLDRNSTLARLKPLLESRKLAKAGHDCKHLTHVLQNYDIRLAGCKMDVLLASYVLNSVAIDHQLSHMAAFYLDLAPVTLDSLLGSGRKKLMFSQLALDQATAYAAQRADHVLRLRDFLQTRLAANARLAGLFHYYEMALFPVLQRMERTGIRLDPELLGHQSQALATRLKELQREVYALAGEEFNLGSPKQLQTIFYDKMKLPVLKKTPKGQPSTAEPVLQELALDYELPKLIIEHRGLSKLKSTYTDKLPLDINKTTGRIHSSFQQAVAATGRLSSTDPNLQNIPIRTPEGRKVRQAFIATPGYKLLAADYSQVELRIMAHLSQDKGLLQAFAEAQDVHRATAAEVFGIPLEEVSAEQRRRAKAINFGLIYGMSAFGLAKQLGIERSDAQHYVDRYFEKYPGVREYMDQTRALADEQGYVETLFGRRLYLPDIHAANGMLRQAAQRTAINAPMQGTAADIIKQAMVDIDHWLETGVLDAKMVLQVHDELVFEVAQADIDLLAAGVRFRMASAAALDVPLVVDIGIGNNWDEAH
ncbi:MAG: DNA polymerase I [Pseudomonadales bacterium]|nr:DNA polymerase I [Pseudomonadales bacterium]